MKNSLTRIHQTLQGKGFFHTMYLVSLVAIAIGLLYSRALLSMGQISLSATFLLEGSLNYKWNALIKNKIALLLIGLYLLHFVGLIYTEDFSYAYKDLRIKIPLLFFPIIFASTSFLTKSVVKKFNDFFILLVISRTLAITAYYIINREELHDMREAFFLISHIRFSLMIGLALVFAIYQAMFSSLKVRWVYLIVSLWMVIFLFYFEMLTGIIVTLLVLAVLLMYLGFRKEQSVRLSKWISYSGLAIVIVISVHLYDIAHSSYIENQLKETEDLIMSDQGNAYLQIYKWGEGNLAKENGYLLYQNLQLDEIQKEWSKRSQIPINYNDTDYTITESVLIRFLSSKGVAKDSLSVASLSDEEIHAIEKRLANASYLGKPGYQVRIQKTMWELDNYFSGQNFNGHSFAMRLEFWKNGLELFKNNFWIGVGTGDVENEYQSQYEKDNSRLVPEWRFRAHNQYISFAVAFGVLGLAYFLISLFIPIALNRKDVIYVCFSIMVLVSMLTEDTLETQIGVSFFAFFNSYFLFREREIN